MSGLDKIRAVAIAALVKNAALLYRQEGRWSDGVLCRFSVSQPSLTQSGTLHAQGLTGEMNVLDVRLLTVHPSYRTPGEGAWIAWDGGRITLTEWTQPSDFTGQATGICRLTR